MEEIYSWIMVSILLSGTGLWIAFSKALRVRKKLVESIPFDATIEIMDEDIEAKGYFSNVSLVMGSISFPPFIYTILISVLILIFGIPNEVINRIAIGGLLAIGISSMFTNIGRSMIYDETILGMNEFGEGSAENFGKHMVFLVVFEVSSIYGQLLAILGLVFSGMLGRSIVDLTMSQANIFLFGCIFLGLSASSNILSGWLFNRTEGPVNKGEDLFNKKIRSLVIPHLINIFGLFIAIYLMVQSGLIG